MPSLTKGWRGGALALAVAGCLALIACREEPPERVISDSPREAIVTVHAVLLLPAPGEAMVGELFEYFELVSARAATGEIPPHWAAYLYINYYRDMARDRPDGRPPRRTEDLEQILDAEVEFYYIRKRPEARPSPVGAWVWQVAPAPIGP